MRKLLVIGALVGAVLAGSPAIAGFEGSAAWGGKGYKLVNVPATGELEKDAQELVDKIKAHFNITDDAMARAKAAALMKSVCAVIEVVKKQNAAVGACLEDLKKKGRICISFGETKAAGIAKTDGMAACTEKDAVNVNIAYVSTECPKIYDPKFLELASTLLHEGTHCTQDYDRPEGTPTALQKAERDKKRACNEVEAHGRERDWAENLLAALMAIMMNPPQAIPAASTDATKAIIEAINKLTGQARTDAIAALKAAAEKIKKDSVRAVDCYEHAKEAFDDFLEAPMDTPEEQQAAKDALKKALAEGSWKAFTKHYANAYVALRHSGNTGTIEQESALISQNLVTGLAGVMDTLLSTDENTLLVSGVTFASQGTIQVYRDFNLNGFFEASEMAIAVPPTGLIHVNLSLVRDPGSGRLYWYDQSTASDLLWLLSDVNLDGVPEGICCVAHAWPHDPMGVIRWMPGAPGEPLLGVNFIDNLLPEFGGTDLRVLLTDTNLDGLYEQREETSEQALSDLPPTWVGTLSPGQFLLGVAGEPMSGVTVFALDPLFQPGEFLGVGTLGTTGTGVVPLTRGLVVGDRVWIQLQPGNTNSIMAVVGAPVMGAPCCWGSGGFFCSITDVDACASLAGKWKVSAPPVCTAQVTCCKANFNAANGVTVQDLFDYLDAWFAHLPSADCNEVGGVTVQDLFDYLKAWFAKCPATV